MRFQMPFNTKLHSKNAIKNYGSGYGPFHIMYLIQPKKWALNFDQFPKSWKEKNLPKATNRCFLLNFPVQSLVPKFRNTNNLWYFMLI